MTTFETSATSATPQQASAPSASGSTGSGSPVSGSAVSAPPGSPAALTSPFAVTDVAQVNGARPSPSVTEQAAVSMATMSSPFLEGLLSDTELAAGDQAAQMLLAEMEDEEFVEALEFLANEAAARTARSPLLWVDQSEAPTLDPTEAEQWMEAVANRAVDTIEELERHFGPRSVESIGDDELDQLLGHPLAEFESSLDSAGGPLDAQEFFFKKLKNKIKKVVKGAKNLVKKGIKFASKFLPINVILKRLKGLIKPLLRRVLAKAIGKLPKNLQEPARRLARKYGLQKEADFETDYEYLSAEFDAEVIEALLGSDAEFTSLEAELQAEVQADSVEPSVATQLDAARRRLGRALEDAEPGIAPTEAMEQFLPVALMPIVKMGVKIAGRQRIVNFVAGLLARLIAPVVGQQLARPLATQIADKGLGLLGLEVAAGQERLGSEAVVAAAEEAINEVFELPEEWLENEQLLEMAVQEAFQAAALRHFPAETLRPGLAASQGRDDGVWMMMPRSTGPAYRYKQYSKPIPVTITPRLARSVVFSGGETLEERLYDEGIDSWPVDGEVEFYELLPGAELGHVAANDRVAAPDSVAATTLEFDTLIDPGELPLPEGERRRRRKGKGVAADDVGAGGAGGAGGGRGGRRGRRAKKRSLVRVKARGRALRRRGPVSVRLDLSGATPALRLHLTIGERRALEVVDKLSRQESTEVLALFTRLAQGPARAVVARRLQAMFRKRQITVEEGVSQALSERLFDGLVAALGAQIQQLAPSLTSAAKDPAPGLTITAAYRFPSTEALSAGEPEAPTLTVRPGRQRD